MPGILLSETLLDGESLYNKSRSKRQFMINMISEQEEQKIQTPVSELTLNCDTNRVFKGILIVL